jgi:hypothetical protein
MLILPAQELAVVILTNVRNGEPKQPLPFNTVFQRKALEELFDGRDLARSEIEEFAVSKRERESKLREGLEREPDPGWLAKLSGSYSNMRLGKVRVSAEAKVGTIDVGEWKTAFGRRVERGGTTKIVLIGPPFAGGDMTLGGDDVHRTLIATDDGATFVFERTK